MPLDEDPNYRATHALKQLHARQEAERGMKTFNIADVTCPFCEEADFDLIGLKMHLTGEDCKRFEECPGTMLEARSYDPEKEADLPKVEDLCPYHDLGRDNSQCVCPPDHPNRAGGAKEVLSHD